MRYAITVFVSRTVCVLTVSRHLLLCGLFGHYLRPKQRPAALHLALVLQPAHGLNAFAFDLALDVAARIPRFGFIAITFYLWFSFCRERPLD
jgi:hypothetical protein